MNVKFDYDKHNLHVAEFLMQKEIVAIENILHSLDYYTIHHVTICFNQSRYGALSRIHEELCLEERLAGHARNIKDQVRGWYINCLLPNSGKKNT